MGRIAVLLSFVRSLAGEAKVSDVKVDPGGGANITAQHFAPAGDDAHPLPDDFAATMSVQRTGSEVAVGYIDPKNEQKAQPGEKRAYARDPEDGSTVVEVWLKNDGSVRGSNAMGSFELQAGGNFVVNGVTIDTAGNITTPATISADTVEATTSLTAAGKEIVAHVHLAGTPPGSTGPNA